jgi:acyl dehydratase
VTPQPKFEVGERLINHEIKPTSIQVVMYAAAMWEYQRIHFDHAWAEREGLPAPIVHGPLLGNYLVQTVERWCGSLARLVELEWRNRGIAPIGEPLTAGGVVTGVAADDSGLVTCDLWIDDAGGERIVTASASLRRTALSLDHHSA